MYSLITSPSVSVVFHRFPSVSQDEFPDQTRVGVTAVRYYKEGRSDFPWPSEYIRENICDVVVNRLASEGKTARRRAAEINARLRAEVAINELGPILSPLVDSPEVGVSGTRIMPDSGTYRADYYEVTGRIDVVINVQIESYPPGTNSIVDLLCSANSNGLGDGHFEVLVDYKGSRRSAVTDSEWRLYEWQLQTYAWLRQQQPDSLPVRAGLIVFINELLPSSNDMAKLKQNIADDATDVRPEPNSTDQIIVLGSPKGESPYGLSWDFRLARSLRVISVDSSNQGNALERFDEIVERIETCVNAETGNGSIQSSWPPIPERDTCVACDFNTMCPASEYLGPAVAPLGRRAPDGDI